LIPLLLGLVPLTSEAAVPILGVAAGTVTAILWLWKYPQDLHVKALQDTQSQILSAWAHRLEACERARDQDRNAYHERVKELEAMHQADTESLRKRIEELEL
jgi:3-methyladenine DNA glycosylase AlkC